MKPLTLTQLEVVPNTKISSSFLRIQNKSDTKSKNVLQRATGFFIVPNLIVTNIHVIVSARSVTIWKHQIEDSIYILYVEI